MVHMNTGEGRAVRKQAVQGAANMRSANCPDGVAQRVASGRFRSTVGMVARGLDTLQLPYLHGASGSGQST